MFGLSGSSETMPFVDSDVFLNKNDDGSAELTVIIDGDDHRFSASSQDVDDRGIVEYEETLTWRGRVVSSEPGEEIWKTLMSSNEMTDFLESNDLEGVRRVR